MGGRNAARLGGHGGAVWEDHHSGRGGGCPAGVTVGLFPTVPSLDSVWAPKSAASSFLVSSKRSFPLWLSGNEPD